MTKTGRIRAWLFLLAAVTFFAGGAVVYSGQRLLVRQETRAAGGDEWRVALAERLSLSVEQDKALEVLLASQREKTRELIEATETGLLDLGQETNEQILEILNEAQKSKYQKLCGGN